jgi:hypothetical protein
MNSDTFIVFECPHCSGGIMVHPNEVNCQIFRHGVFANGEYISPHALDTQVNAWLTSNKIYGCGGQLKYNLETGKAECFKEFIETTETPGAQTTGAT